MAALDFPANPTNGQEFNGYIWNATKGVWDSNSGLDFNITDLADVDTTGVVDGNALVYDGINSQWIPGEGGGGGSYTISATAPADPGDGDVWFDSTDGLSYIYYNDGDTSQWIEIGNQTVGPQGTEGPTGPAGADGPQGEPGRFITSAIAPPNPTVGDSWFNTTTGQTFIYYEDYDSTGQWVETGYPLLGYDTLANLSDTNINSASDGQILSYNASLEKWVGQTLNIDKSLSELTDVTVANPTNNQVLAYASGSSEWQNISITDQTEVQALIDRDDKAYCQVNKIAGQSFTTGHQNILLDDLEKAKNITLDSNQLTFALPGIYQINVGFRWGSGTDTWSGVNLYNSIEGIVGRSFGTGQLNSSDAGPAMFNFMADIQDTSVAYYLRLYRAGGTLAIATPDTEAGKAIVATIVKVS